MQFSDIKIVAVLAEIWHEKENVESQFYLFKHLKFVQNKLTKTYWFIWLKSPDLIYYEQANIIYIIFNTYFA